MDISDMRSRKFAGKSVTLVSLLVLVILFVFKQTGKEVEESEIRGFVVLLLEIIAMIGVLIGRWRHGDLHLQLWKTK